MTARAPDDTRRDLERNGASELVSLLTNATPTCPDAREVMLCCFSVFALIYRKHQWGTSVATTQSKTWHLSITSKKCPPGPVQPTSPSLGGGHCSLPHAHLSGYTDGDHSVLLLEAGLDDVTLQANGGAILTWREEQSGSQVYPRHQILGTTGH